MSSNKRKKTDDGIKNDDEDDDAKLLNLLEGEDFATEGDSRKQQQAEKRRLDRKRRFERSQAPDDETPQQQQQQEQEAVAMETSPIIKTGEEPQELKAVDEDGIKEEDDDDDDDDDDEFDMFSSSVSPVGVGGSAKSTKSAVNAAAIGGEGTQQDWDDSEGYYKTVIGEIISIDAPAKDSQPELITTSTEGGDDNAEGIKLRVLGVIGKGVFSSVLKCNTTSNATSIPLPPVVAVKCIRHNETMAKSAFSEIQVLQRLNNSPGIVPLLLPTSTTPVEHRGHILLVFPCADYNLRDVLQKFGKGVGLSLEAVRSYFGQLLAAASHLKKHGIIHSDLKPDNILVSRDFSVVQLGDFGSALEVSSSSQTPQPTPYLVSRFYRAPEIILGLVPTFAIDLWSLAVSVAEIFLGDVLFKGKNNNDMIYSFMQHLGPFSNRLIRQHVVQTQKMPIPAHFMQRTEGAGSDYLFVQNTLDPVTGNSVNKYISLFSSANNSNDSNQHEVFPSTPLSRKLLKAKSAKDSRILVLMFKDLLQKCLVLDPSRRVNLKDALQHDFFTKSIAKKATATTDGTAVAATS